MDFLKSGLRGAVRETYFPNGEIDFNVNITALTTMDVNAQAISALHHNQQVIVVDFLEEKGWLAIDLLDELRKLCDH